MRHNLILNTDSYKLSHFLQYPPGTLNASSYIEARVGGDFDEVLFFGLQGFLNEYLTKPITEQDVIQAAKIAKAHGLPFNIDGWIDIVMNCAGYLPLIIEALPEGVVVPCGTPLVQVRATKPGYAWLVSYIETALLRAVWYPTTVATLSREIKKRIKTAFEVSADTDGKLPFMLHDFGARGVSSHESAMIGGGAHLVNFQGTDTVSAILWLMEHYGTEAMPAFSLPASEHSTMTSWGREFETEAYRNMLQKFPTGLVAIVSDSYDLFNAIDNIFGDDLKDEVLSRDGTLVVRPDSGVPEEIVPKVLDRLWLAFGGKVNTKGYKLLDDHVRVIQGDGINLHSIEGIIDAVHRHGFSIENLAFGMGGALLQQVNRDTLRFAMKCNAIETEDEEWVDVYKKPATDPTKTSKAGVQSVIYHALSGEIVTMRRDEYQKVIDESGGNEHWGEGDDLLVPVWQDGNLLRRTTFDEVRERANYRV